MELLGHAFSFGRHSQGIFQSDCASVNSTTVYESSSYCTLLPTLDILCPFVLAILVDVQWVHMAASICIYLMTGEIQPLFMSTVHFNILLQSTFFVFGHVFLFPIPVNL